MEAAYKQLKLYCGTLKEISSSISLKEFVVFGYGLYDAVNKTVNQIHGITSSLRKLTADDKYEAGNIKAQKLKVIDDIFIKVNMEGLNQIRTKADDNSENVNFYEGIKIAGEIKKLKDKNEL
jgi:hypothetical protein